MPHRILSVFAFVILCTSASAQTGGDTCALADPIAGLGSFPFDSIGASDSGLAYCATSAGISGATGEFWQDVWFEWTSDVSGSVTFGQHSVMDGLIGIYDGNDCATSLMAVCADCVGGCVDELSYTVTAGNSYLIVIGGWNDGSATTGTLEIAQMGTNYCTGSPNDVTPAGGAEGALMWATGSTSVSKNDLVLYAGPILNNQPGILYHGNNQVNGGAGLPFGDGMRCVGGLTVRYFPPIFADPAGTLVQVVDNQQFNIVISAVPIVDMATLNFQFWYRSPTGPFGAGGMSGFNLSDALQLTFTP